MLTAALLVAALGLLAIGALLGFVAGAYFLDEYVANPFSDRAMRSPCTVVESYYEEKTP